jgi:hypothetical protein
VNVSKEVIKDLLPLYASGEASPDTCELVQQCVLEDPELAELLRQIAEGDELLRGKPPVPDLERSQVRSFKKARTLIRYRSGILGAAIAYTLLPFAFVYSNGHVRWIVLSDMPGAALSSIVIALALWATYVVLSVRARKIGL